MKKRLLVTYLKNHQSLFTLFIILLIGIFYRVFRIYEWMLYGHDQDLAAWIVKDIVVDHHLRLIGQQTSIDGLFIGGLYYYAQIPFYLLFNMHPLGSVPFAIIVGIITIISIFVVFKKLFSTNVGLISAFLYAISHNHNFSDRWAVPTQPTVLWSIWFFYVLVSFSRGNLKALPILFILVSLIWHIHIAFVPLLVLLPIAWFLSRKNIMKELKQLNKKWLVISLLISSLLVLPLLIFELRHGFQQLIGLLSATTEQRGAITGLERLYIIIQNLALTMIFPFIFSGKPVLYQFNLTVLAATLGGISLFIGLGFYFLKQKLFKKNDLILILIWYGVIFLGQFLTKRPISEYYFFSLLVFPLLFAGLLSVKLLQNRISEIIILTVFAAYALINFSLYITKEIPSREYYYIEQTIKFIKADAEKNNYGCVGLNFFGEPGAGVGFFYPIWYYKLNVVRPDNEVATYNIAVPAKSSKEVNATFGDFGIILPERSKLYNAKDCTKPEKQLLPPLGFTN